MIRPVTTNDAADICAIYNYYVENSRISFEEETITLDEMKDRISHFSAHYPWLVFETDGKVQAYAYAKLWKKRSAYRYTLESSVYASPDLSHKGVGTQLYLKLFAELESRFVRSVMAVIALPNPASIGLHEKMGFEKVAHFKEVGFKQDKWIDVGYWQKTL